MRVVFQCKVCAGSSEALLSGQKPPFRLLIRAMNTSDNSRATNIAFRVSDAFVVSFASIWPNAWIERSGQINNAVYDVSFVTNDFHLRHIWAYFLSIHLKHQNEAAGQRSVQLYASRDKSLYRLSLQSFLKRFWMQQSGIFKTAKGCSYKEICIFPDAPWCPDSSEFSLRQFLDGHHSNYNRMHLLRLKTTLKSRHSWCVQAFGAWWHVLEF